ncbi:MAG: AAA family ATPase [Desulfobacterales bacterium]|nr:AAA family ATPase [Desulfobacterales bacterium]
MQIQRIQIINLFGMFDHDINLKVDDRITIIHGPNGVGKTTILKLIKDIFDRRFYALKPVPFSEIIITFINSYKLRLKKTDDENITLSLKKGNKKLGQCEIKMSVPKEKIERIGPIDELTRLLETILLNAVISDDLPVKNKYISDEIENVLKELRTYFIQTQRLTVLSSDESYSHQRPEIKTLNTVEKYSSEMAKMLQEIMRESGSVAASLDRTFPHRLFKSELPKEATEGKIREKYQQQSSYIERLMKAGLLEEEQLVALPESSLGSSDLKFLWYYLTDIDNKLEVFSSLLEKVELFKDIINSRFLYKSFFLDKSEGFVFCSDNGGKVPPRTLSSGEQHEIVLAYELIFKVPEKSFIMIDEPELSLHVTWQHKFLNDLERISKLVDLDFLIATHSPSVIHNRRSLMVALEKESNSA